MTGTHWDDYMKKGMIHDPVGKAKSVSLTPEGLERCKQLFHEMFVRNK